MEKMQLLASNFGLMFLRQLALKDELRCDVLLDDSLLDVCKGSFA
jgi:hypothetical protein